MSKSYQVNQGSHVGLDENGKECTWLEGETFTTNQDLSNIAGPDPKGFKLTLISDNDQLVTNQEIETETKKTKKSKDTPTE